MPQKYVKENREVGNSAEGQGASNKRAMHAKCRMMSVKITNCVLLLFSTLSHLDVSSETGGVWLNAASVILGVAAHIVL